MSDWLLFIAAAMPVVMGLAAIGAVLLIKIGRRRVARHPPSGAIDEVVPAQPMSEARSARILRNYLLAAVLMLAALLIWAAGLSVASPG